MKVGKKIRMIRELKGFSQEYMSIQLEIAQTTYSRIETDKTRIDIQKLAVIAELLDTNLINLLVFDENNIHSLIAKSCNYDVINANDEYKGYESRVIRLEEKVDFIHKIISLNNKS